MQQTRNSFWPVFPDFQKIPDRFKNPDIFRFSRQVVNLNFIWHSQQTAANSEDIQYAVNTPSSFSSAPSVTACIVAHTSSKMLMIPGTVFDSINSQTTLLLKKSIGTHFMPSWTYSSWKKPTTLRHNHPSHEELCKIRCKRANHLYGALSRRGLDPIQLAYNACQPIGRLKLTVSAYNWLQTLCQQSWSQGLLQHRTRHFFPSSGGAKTLWIYPSDVTAAVSQQ